jgi:hypothetical protein
MSDAIPQIQQQCRANLDVLRQQLEEMATKRHESRKLEQHQNAPKLVPFICGK